MKKSEKKRTAYYLLQIFLIFLLSYVVMVFISHFSVYNSSETYKISDSFDAMLLKTDVPSEFFLYFGAFVVITVLLSLFVNFFRKKMI
jgi:Ca2+/Na+ antiporter